MLLLKKIPASIPQLVYVADAATGDVHRVGCAYIYDAQERFLDLRTALVHGYELCPHCINTQRSAPSPAAQRFS